MIPYMKRITSPGSMNDTGCSGLVHWDHQRLGMGKEVGGGFRMGNMCTPVVNSCWCMEKPIQYCKVISLHHWLDGLESEWTPGVVDGQGGLACCSYGVTKSWTLLSNWTELNWVLNLQVYGHVQIFLAKELEVN